MMAFEPIIPLDTFEFRPLIWLEAWTPQAILLEWAFAESGPNNWKLSLARGSSKPADRRVWLWVENLLGRLARTQRGIPWSDVAQAVAVCGIEPSRVCLGSTVAERRRYGALEAINGATIGELVWGRLVDEVRAASKGVALF